MKNSNGTLARVLIVDDSRSTVRDFAEMLEGMADCSEAYSSEDALRLINSEAHDVMLLDYDLGPGLNGQDILKHINAREIDVRVIMISKHDGFENVKFALWNGACDFLGKTPSRQELRDAVEMALLKVKEPAVTRRNGRSAMVKTWLLTGSSEAVTRINSEILRIAPNDAAVFVTGESGTGKERVAQALHCNSNRAGKPFIAVNCASFNAHLADSELFGHRKGAYSSGDYFRKGAFAEANGGTLFLDEVGDMDLDVQKKLLRVLEAKEFKRLGTDETIKTDVRLICATNADVQESLRSGRLRNDLYQRIKVAAIHVPPLRERPEDIRELTDDLLKMIGKEYGEGVITISGDARQALANHPWLGNTRELYNTLLNATIHCKNRHIASEQITDVVGVPVDLGTYEKVKNEALAKIIKQYFNALAVSCKYNKSEMARRAGLTRAGLDKILKMYGINFSRGEDRQKD